MTDESDMVQHLKAETEKKAALKLSERFFSLMTVLTMLWFGTLLTGLATIVIIRVWIWAWRMMDF